MTYLATHFRPGKNPTQYSFTLILNQEIILPGFTTYDGKIQAPAKQYKKNWYPGFYTSREQAGKIYNAVVEAAPDGMKLLPCEEAVSKLVYNEAVVERLTAA